MNTDSTGRVKHLLTKLEMNGSPLFDVHRFGPMSEFSGGPWAVHIRYSDTGELFDAIYGLSDQREALFMARRSVREDIMKGTWNGLISPQDAPGSTQTINAISDKGGK